MAVVTPRRVIEDQWDTETHRCRLMAEWTTDEHGCDMAKSWSVYVDEGSGAWVPYSSVHFTDERDARQTFLMMLAIATGAPLPQFATLQEMRDWQVVR